MKIADVMQTEFCAVHGQATLKEAEEAMNQQPVGLLPVRREDSVVGMVSRLDLLNGMLDERPEGPVRVRDVMRRELPCCDMDDDLNKVAEYMTKRNKRYLLVVGRDYQLRGIVSRSVVQAGLQHARRKNTGIKTNTKEE